MGGVHCSMQVPCPGCWREAITPSQDPVLHVHTCNNKPAGVQSLLCLLSPACEGASRSASSARQALQTPTALHLANIPAGFDDHGLAISALWPGTPPQHLAQRNQRPHVPPLINPGSGATPQENKNTDQRDHKFRQCCSTNARSPHTYMTVKAWAKQLLLDAIVDESILSRPPQR